jgi:hypothetical protein
MKKVVFILFILLNVFNINAQDLRFHGGKFKILQLTDLHYILNTPAADAALKNIDELVDAEKPDLIMVSGDIVYGKPGDATLQVVLNTISAHKIPFAMIFGNHDGEQGTPLTVLYDKMHSTPYNVQPDRRITKITDYVLPIKSSNGARTAALIYCFDTHDRSNIRDVGGYQWLKFDQIKWYRNRSAQFRSLNGGHALPSIAFMHIPLPEYNLAVENTQCVLYGSRMEKAYTASLNSGMFTAIKECGDIMGVFCGHDHDNDYSVSYFNVLLAHGRFSGGNTVYNHLTPGKQPFFAPKRHPFTLRKASFRTLKACLSQGERMSFTISKQIFHGFI